VPSRLLTEMPCLQLVAKPMEAPRIPEPKQEQPEALAFKPKSIPEPLTDAQLRDRREMLRQQAALLAKGGHFAEGSSTVKKFLPKC
jgi:hypothetical protein